jgi:benzoyl-CoA reductase/2-hydroxyglutaryl-CoA dehydratase subunit BcrC/BadD/HgdB
MDRKEHLDLVADLTNQLKMLPPAAAAGINVGITGIMYDGKNLLDLLEENHINIVGDDLSQETRQFAVDCPMNHADPMECLTRQWSLMCPDSVVFDFDRMARGKRIAELVRERGATGVIFSGMKFCEPEEYDFVMVKKQLEQENIPLLFIEVDQQTQENQTVNTRLQAFTELLSSSKKEKEPVH